MSSWGWIRAVRAAADRKVRAFDSTRAGGRRDRDRQSSVPALLEQLFVFAELRQAADSSVVDLEAVAVRLGVLLAVQAASLISDIAAYDVWTLAVALLIVTVTAVRFSVCSGQRVDVMRLAVDLAGAPQTVRAEAQQDLKRLIRDNQAVFRQQTWWFRGLLVATIALCFAPPCLKLVYSAHRVATSVSAHQAPGKASARSWHKAGGRSHDRSTGATSPGAT